MYKKIKEAWKNDEDFCSRLIIAFTHGESLLAQVKKESKCAWKAKGLSVIYSLVYTFFIFSLV